MAGTESQSYIRYNSIHHSFQRAVTTHGSESADIIGNFAYHIYGHSIFVEDGVERFNNIEYNLVCRTLATSAGLRGDTEPASFWAQTPLNFWRHNVAAGSDSSGYWFELLGSPGGPSFSPDICPNTHQVRVLMSAYSAPWYTFCDTLVSLCCSIMPPHKRSMQLGEFHNNTAHSSPFGFRIYPGWIPLVNECGRTDGLANAAPQILTNSTMHHISDRGIYWKSAGAVQFSGWAFVSNTNYDARIFVVVIPPSVAWFPHLTGALFVCNPGGSAACDQKRPASLHLPGSEDYYINGATWWGYGGVPAMLTCNMCSSDIHALMNGGYTYRTANTALVDTASWMFFAPPRKDIFWDQDGTLTGRGANSFAVAPWQFNAWPECPGGGSLFNGAQLCAGVTVRRMHLQATYTSALDYTVLQLASTAGIGGVQYLPAADWVGWSVPLVSQKTYNFSWVGYIGDWTQLRFRWSELEYALPNGQTVVADWAIVQNSAPTPRWATKDVYAGTGATRPIVVGRTLDASIDVLGTSASVGTNNKTWAVMLDSRGYALSANTLPKMGVQFDALAVFCPEGGCIPPPPKAPAGAPMNWSNPTTWPSGVLPAAGDAVTIAPNVTIIFDVTSTPVLSSLTIYGSLIFLDGAPRFLLVGMLSVWGSLTIGTPSAPFLSRAVITFYGSFGDPQLAIDSNTVAGNKGMVVFGRVSIVGPPQGTTWIRLNATAVVGSATLSLATPASSVWTPGDKIVLGATSYNAFESEVSGCVIFMCTAGRVMHVLLEMGAVQVKRSEGSMYCVFVGLLNSHDSRFNLQVAQIAAISVDRRTISLVSPLSARHFAGPVGSTPVASNVVLAGAVGRLSRNIVLQSNLSAPIVDSLTSPVDDYGLHILVTSTGIGGGYSGSVLMSGVEIRGCGKYINDHPCIRAQFGGWPASVFTPARTSPVVFDSVSIHGLMYYGVQAVSAPGVIFKNSVIFGGTPNVVDFDDKSPNATLTGNLVVGPYQRPDSYTVGQLVWFRPTSAFYLIAPVPGIVSGNLVQGAYDAAYTFFPDSCGGVSRVFGNEAVSGRTGIYILAGPNQSPSCIALVNFTLWAVAHSAIAGVDLLSSVLVTGAVISDSHIGIAINPVVDPTTVQTIAVANSILLGTTAVSGSTCTVNKVCRAMSAGDPLGTTCGSVLGPRYRRAGMLVPVFSNAAKTCGVNGILHPCRPLNTPVRACSMPWEKRYGVTGAYAHIYITNVAFVAFGAEAPCGNESSPASAALVGNPTAVNYSPPFTLVGITWEATPLSGQFDFSWGGSTLGSSAQLLLTLTDVDGSTTGIPGAAILGPNPALADSDCTFVPQWTAYTCNEPMRGAFIENGDSDVCTRNLGTLTMTREPSTADNTTWRVANSMFPSSDGCSSADGCGRYPMVLQLGLETVVGVPSLNPSNWIVHIMADNPAESAIIAMRFTRRLTWNVFVDGVQVPGTAPTTNMVSLPQLTDPPGTNAEDPIQRLLYVTLRGGNHKYAFAQTAAVQVTLALSISYNQFYLNDFLANLAKLLGIPLWRIIVADVQPAGARQRRALRGDATTPTEGNDADDDEIRWTWLAPRRILAAGGTNVDLNIQDILNITVLVDPNNASSVAEAQAQHDRLSALSSRIVNSSITGDLSTVGNVSIAGVAVADLPPRPTPPPTFAQYVIPISDIVGGNRTNGTYVGYNGTGGVQNPSSTSASTPSATLSASISPNSTPSYTSSASSTDTPVPTPTSTISSYVYARGSANGPPHQQLQAWLRSDGFATAMPSIASWPNAMAFGGPGTPAVPSAALPAVGFAAPYVALDAITGMFVPTFEADIRSSLVLNTSTLAAGAMWSVFFVVRMIGPAYGRVVTDAATNTWAVGATTSLVDVAVTPAGAGGASVTLSATPPALHANSVRHQWLLYGFVRDADGLGYLYRDGQLLAVGAAVAPPRGALRLGGGALAGSSSGHDFSDCAIGEVLVYSAALGQSSFSANVSRFDIEGYLAHKWAVGLPASHPFYIPPTPSGTATPSRTPSATRTASRTSTRSSSGTKTPSRTHTGTRTSPRTPTSTVTVSKSPKIK